MINTLCPGLCLGHFCFYTTSGLLRKFLKHSNAICVTPLMPDLALSLGLGRGMVGLIVVFLFLDGGLGVDFPIFELGGFAFG